MIRWRSLPAAVYSLVERTPGAVLLEDARSGGNVSRLFLSPQRTLEVHAPDHIADFFAEIEQAVSGGKFAAGFFSYECGQAFEPTARFWPSARGVPLAWFGIYERAYVFDHAAGGFVGASPDGIDAPDFDRDSSTPTPETKILSGLTEDQFAASIAAIHEWIRAGDVYQLNFTFPLQLRAANCGSSWAAALYADLRRRQPVEYSAFLHWSPGRHILSLSPELFFRIEDHGATRRIVTRPMKGTAPRGRTNAEDRHIADQLRNDEKNRSENVMIVDLLRNDLGRLCAFGSVQVEKLFDVERYPTLWQMTSTITGQLRSEIHYHNIFRALFPCGSVTGAPKVRAMQLLAELEAEPRGVYTGSIGFFSREQTVFNVAIRTLEVDGMDARMGVGSGIVIDSRAADEYRECLLKAEFLRGEEEPFSLIETLRWENGYPLLALHLDRLEDSANYFDFACNRANVEEALLSAAHEFHEGAPRRVRLLLDADGSTHIDAVKIASDAIAAKICLAAQPTDSSDRFLFHKTTRRALYAAVHKAATDALFADVVFLNEKNELTEGAISNVFVEKSGRWQTPPVACGLLAGVYRRHLLATRPEIEERVLHLDDLEQADAIYLANAVRGLRRVTMDWDALV